MKLFRAVKQEPTLLKNLSATPIQAPGLAHKQQTRLERLARDKHSCLLQKFVTYGRKKFYNIGPWWHHDIQHNDNQHINKKQKLFTTFELDILNVNLIVS